VAKWLKWQKWQMAKWQWHFDEEQKFFCHRVAICHFATGMAMAIKFCHRVAIYGKWQLKNRKMANMAKMANGNGS
jgi:hypothetical protein